MTFKKYANQVIACIPAKAKIKKRIREDIINQLEEMGLRENIDNPIEAMGEPKEVAAEFMENLDIESSLLGSIMGKRAGFEYKSNREIFGMPFIHITGDRRIAKGFIAIGGISIGVFSFGGVSFGLVSFGGLSVGLLFALGGLSLSFGLAIGGLALGYLFALGGAAVSKVLAIGGGAWASDIAIGDYASGKVCGYFSDFDGEVGINLVTNKTKLVPTVKEYFPNLFGIYYNIVEWASKIPKGTMRYNK